MRTFFLVLAVALVIIGLIAGGTYLSEPLWLHALKDKSGNLDPGALLKLVVVVPAAVVGLLSSILAGLASYLVAKANHASALTLADKQFEYTTKTREDAQGRGGRTSKSRKERSLETWTRSGTSWPAASKPRK